MLVLLPPSEGKHAPRAGAPIDLGALVHPELTAAREAVLAALVRLAAGPRRPALAALGLTPGQAAELERDAGLRTAPAAPAAEIYAGVLFQHLDLASLPPAARARARERVLVASALWGVVALDDRIPAYRLAMGARLPALIRSRARAGTRPPVAGLAAWWRPRLSAAMPDEDGALVLDLRSGAYAAAWRPARATTVEIRALAADGRPISHMAKAVRGRVARRVLLAARAPRDPAGVAALAGDAGEHVALHAPGRAGLPWTIEVRAG